MSRVSSSRRAAPLAEGPDKGMFGSGSLASVAGPSRTSTTGWSAERSLGQALEFVSSRDAVLQAETRFCTRRGELTDEINDLKKKLAEADKR